MGEGYTMPIIDLIRDVVSMGDVVLFHSDLKRTSWVLKDFFNGDLLKATQYFLDALVETVGEEGTLLIPCFNWDFCKGLPFNYKNTKAQTGTLSNLALNDRRFRRTKHPIYSFMVYGKHCEYLCSLDNFSSFGMDSPFGFIYKKNGKIVLWDVDYQSSFTFAHFVEQQLNVDYRYEKIFEGKYIDESGNQIDYSCSMFVRRENIITHLEPIGKILEDDLIVSKYEKYGIEVKVMRAKDAYERIALEVSRYPYVMVRFEAYDKYKIGQEMHDLIRRLFPINRSITGRGLRKSLNIIKEYMPDLEIKEVKSGEQCFDWTVPMEWNIEEAFIEELEGGKRIVDFRKHNLHVVGYSTPIDAVLDYDKLVKHLHFREDLPDAIPYVTSYYKDYWGFCIRYSDFLKLDRNKKYRVFIKSEFKRGVLNYGECFVKGATEKEILFSTYICHPSMANNELSGPALAVYLYKYIKKKANLNYSYRFVFVPETIGSICYISKNLEKLKNNVVAGFVLTCCGDEGVFSYVPSRYGNTLADKVALNLLEFEVRNFKRYSFLDRGSDERQYCAPGVDLPVCSVMKSKYGEYKEYHTSLDDLNFVTPKGLEESYNFYIKVIEILENNGFYKTKVICEPFMSKRGLYRTLSHLGTDEKTKLMMDFIAYADGTNDLIDIANILGVSAFSLIHIKDILLNHQIIEKL